MQIYVSINTYIYEIIHTKTLFYYIKQRDNSRCFYGFSQEFAMKSMITVVCKLSRIRNLEEKEWASGLIYYKFSQEKYQFSLIICVQ
jgi:hypothetical protein